VIGNMLKCSSVSDLLRHDRYGTLVSALREKLTGRYFLMTTYSADV
jgi:hypothetical protein